MGLDTTHNAWHGPYGMFMRFRVWLGKQIGIDILEYAAYHDKGTKDLLSIQHPLLPLFNHSDCEGELIPDECKSIADGLEEVIKNAENNPDNQFFIEKAIQFRDGCLLAYSKGESIEFR